MKPGQVKPYPASDHCDGERFFNPEPPPRAREGRRRGLFYFLLRRLRRDPEIWSKWPKRVENPGHPPPGAWGGEGAALTFLGHSSFLLRLPGLTMLTDPIFSARCSPIPFLGPRRVRDPGVALEALPRVDVTLLSHNHYDHMDLPSLRGLRRRFPEMRIIAPLGNAAYLARKGLPGATELDWWESVTLHGTQITATPARHFSARALHDRNRTLWCGFMLAHESARIYVAGDTGYTRFFREIRTRLGSPGIALLPIGAYEPRDFMRPVHLNPADAVQAFLDLEASFAIGKHFGTFQLTAEPFDQPEADLAIARAAAGIGRESFLTLQCGETRVFSAG